MPLSSAEKICRSWLLKLSFFISGIYLFARVLGHAMLSGEWIFVCV